MWDGKIHSYRPAADWRSSLSSRLDLHSEVDPNLDSVTFEVIRNRLWTSNLAHGETLTRISGSPVFQALDLNMCILTEDAEIVMNGPFILHLVTGSTLAIKYVMQHFSDAPGINEGDMFMGSDPWVGAAHQMDIMIMCPVFVDGRLFAWVSNAGHQYDLGGIVPGGWPQNAPDVYSDPTLFTPFKLVERGVLRSDLERMYKRQSRQPDLVALDLRAQLAGCRYAEQALLEMCRQFGATTVKAAMRRVGNDAQRSFQGKLERLPDGKWSQVNYFDVKMPGDRNNYRTQVAVTKAGDRLIIDNDGTQEQQEGPLGFTYAVFFGAAMGALSVTMLWEQMFSVGGAERQIEFRPNTGTITCVDYPAAVSGSSVNIGAFQNVVMSIAGRMLFCDPEFSEDVFAEQPPTPLLPADLDGCQERALGGPERT